MVAYAGDGLVAIVVRGKVVGGKKKNTHKTHNPNSELFLAVIDLLSSVKIELSSCNKPFKSTGC